MGQNREPPRHHAQVALATPAPVTHRTAEENLGLAYLAAVLRRAGFEVGVVDGWLEGLSSAAIAERITAVNPCLVGVACYRSNITAAVEVLQIVRNRLPEALTVAGGYGPTFHSEDFLNAGFDVVVIGEGEQVLLEMARTAASGRPDAAQLTTIRGIAFLDGDGHVVRTPSRPPVADLDTLPLPERDTLALSLARRSPVHLQSSRGCQASCTFCSIVAFERVTGGPQWRQRSITGLVDELEALATQGVRHIKVIDDSLIEPPRDGAWCNALADEVQRRDLRLSLRGQIRADRVDARVVTELRRAGFWSFSCGIENFAPTALRRMAKRASVEANHTALEIFRRAGITVQAGHILFDHETTLTELELNYAGLLRHSWTVSKGIFTEMYAATGTPYTRALARRGALTKGTAAPGTAGLGNATYRVFDPAARAVHAALKTWQRSHTRTYDMTIDPLAAPKAIDEPDRLSFHLLTQQLREQDLVVLRGLLDLLSDRPTTCAQRCQDEALQYVNKQISATTAFYDDVRAQTIDAYQRAGLIYDAQENPFLC